MCDFDISILIVNYNTAHLLDEMFGSLYRSIFPGLKVQVIVVDNASADDSVDLLRSHYPDVKMIVNEVNVGFGRANNQGVPYIQGRYVLLLNTDAFVAPDTLAKTIAYMDTHSNCGVLGVKLVGRDGELQPSCRYFPTPWNMFLTLTGLSRVFKTARLVDSPSWDCNAVTQCDWVPGCYFLIRREVIDQVGLFDPRYFLYSEEVDLCRSVKNAGWDVTYYPETSVVHLGGESAKSDSVISTGGRQVVALQAESELLYFRKYHGVFGILQHLLLSMVGDVIVTMKLLKNGCPALAFMRIKHVLLVWKLCYFTRFGKINIR